MTVWDTPPPTTIGTSESDIVSKPMLKSMRRSGPPPFSLMSFVLCRATGFRDAPPSDVTWQKYYEDQLYWMEQIAYYVDANLWSMFSFLHQPLWAYLNWNKVGSTDPEPLWRRDFTFYEKWDEIMAYEEQLAYYLYSVNWPATKFPYYIPS